MQGSDHRALRAGTTLYLLLPAILFAAGWLRTPAALVSGALLSTCACLALRDIYRAWQAARSAHRGAPRPAWAWVLPGLATVAAWLMLSGAGGLGYQNLDHQASNALLKALIAKPWPLTLLVNGEHAPLIYYVGYYLPAAWVGKAFGWLSANLFLFGWTALGTALALRWFHHAAQVELRGRSSRLLWLVLIFCLAGGLDYWMVFLTEGQAPNLTRHLEFWSAPLQFSSQTDLLFWTPQHAIAGWLLTGLLVDALTHTPDPRHLALALAAGVIWTPFAALGLLPFLLWAAVRYLRSARSVPWRSKGTLLSLAAALWVGAVHGLYLLSNRFQFPIQWLWETTSDWGALARLLILFWLVEFGILTLAVLAFALTARDRLPRGGLSPQQASLGGLSLGVLLALPVFHVGFYNDLVMRASIPALFIGWACVARLILHNSVDGGPGRARLGQALTSLLVVLLVGAGFMPALTEISRSIHLYSFGPPAWSTVATMEAANAPEIVRQRAGDPEALFFRYVGRPAPPGDD